MNRTDFRKGLAVLVAVFLVVSISPLWAAGSQEAEHHDEEHHHEGEMVMPHIEPADLGNGEALTVVASTSIVGDVVRRVAGSAATVDVLMPVGQNPHAYEPTPRAIAGIEESYIVFVNGLDLEEALMEAIESTADTYVVPVSAGIEVLGGGHEDEHDGDGDHDGHEHAAGDPHFWFDPTNVIVWAQNIADALSEADPGNGATYAANRDAYVAELEALDAEIRAQVAAIPPEERKLVVDHVALTYFAEEYGFEIIGEVIPSVSDQAEPSAQHIAELADVIRAEGVSVIVIGGTAGSGLRNLVRAVAEEVGRDLRIAEILTGSLAQTGSRGDTYVDFARFNTERIISAFGR